MATPVKAVTTCAKCREWVRPSTDEALWMWERQHYRRTGHRHFESRGADGALYADRYDPERPQIKP